jgi:Asp-tRNA(Asn)/Glu-tRNA(Gln) amidotransferase A subunit family amidase
MTNDDESVRSAVEVLRRAGYRVIPPEVPDELDCRARSVADLLAAYLGPAWRRRADNSLGIDEEGMTVTVVVSCYRRALRG